jgi:hypothetical protein
LLIYLFVVVNTQVAHAIAFISVLWSVGL